MASETRQAGETFKRCRTCGEEKTVADFGRKSAARDRLQSLCRRCDTMRRRAELQARRREDPVLSWANRAVRGARCRARASGLAFALTVADVLAVAPSVCPALGVTLTYPEGDPAGRRPGGKPSSPSIDRINGERGYIPSNIQVISYRANTAKSDLSSAELDRLAAFVRGLHHSTQ